MMQGALNLKLNQGVSFDDYWADPSSAVLQKLQHINALGANYMLLGPQGSGKTHLLMAACNAWHLQGAAILYVPLRDASLDSKILHQLDAHVHLFLDDIDAVIGSRNWELALLHSHDRRGKNVRMIASSRTHLDALSFAVKDLKSRLLRADSDGLAALNDEQKMAALALKARLRGFEFPQSVLHYLIRQYSRDMKDLSETVARLDRLSLREQRRVTVPWVREKMREISRFNPQF